MIKKDHDYSYIGQFIDFLRRIANIILGLLGKDPIPAEAAADDDEG